MAVVAVVGFMSLSTYMYILHHYVQFVCDQLERVI